MRTRCFCDKCHGTYVSLQTKLNHERKQLKAETISEQLERKCYRDILPAEQHGARPSSSSVVSPVDLHPPSGISTHSTDISGPSGVSDGPGSLGPASTLASALDVFNHLGYDTTLAIFSNADDVNPEYVPKDNVDFPDEDSHLEDADLREGGDQSITLTPPMSIPTEDDVDPFVVEPRYRPGTVNHQDSETPEHLLVVYTMVSWLHFQFHLPRAACNAVLAFLALLFRFFSLAITPPFISLQSATRALGVDPLVELLAVCPQCKGVYPSSSSRYMQDMCSACHIPLFLLDHMRQGNRCTIKTPVIKYSYLPLMDQIAAILKVPGMESLLDDWRIKPRNPGEYGNIFDGRMCWEKLKAPDGTLFFSNCPHEQNGPDNKLQIGINLGV